MVCVCVCVCVCMCMQCSWLNTCLRKYMYMYIETLTSQDMYMYIETLTSQGKKVCTAHSYNLKVLTRWFPFFSLCSGKGFKHNQQNAHNFQQLIFFFKEGGGMQSTHNIHHLNNASLSSYHTCTHICITFPMSHTCTCTTGAGGMCG